MHRLEENPQTPAALLRAAAYNGDSVLVRRLIDEGVDVNVWDNWGRTALSFASREGHVEVVRILVTANAWVDPHEDYDTFETPLIAAAEEGHLEIVKCLIAAGADPSVHAGVSQGTAEFYARTNGRSDVAEYLLAQPLGGPSRGGPANGVSP